jgi:hypothetical protein
MAMKRSAALAMTGLGDPREMLQKDLVRMYSDYILGPGAQKNQPAKTAASLEPGWGDPVEADEEEEISADKGQIVEFDEDEDEAQPVNEPEVAEEEAAAEEEIDAGLADVPAVSRKNTYEDELLALLEKAKSNLEAPKKLSIADILGAGTMRRSAELIRKTEQENEKRRQTAQELAVDILMRKSASEEKRQAAESLADYRRRMLGKPKPDPTIVQVAKRAYPNLPEDKAIQAYLDSRKAKPSEPRLTETEKLAALRAKQKRGQPLTLEEQELLTVLNDKVNRMGVMERAMMKSLGLEN